MKKVLCAFVVIALLCGCSPVSEVELQMQQQEQYLAEKAEEEKAHPAPTGVAPSPLEPDRGSFNTLLEETISADGTTVAYNEQSDTYEIVMFRDGIAATIRKDISKGKDINDSWNDVVASYIELTNSIKERAVQLGFKSDVVCSLVDREYSERALLAVENGVVAYDETTEANPFMLNTPPTQE